jgi:hypothetical protein
MLLGACGSDGGDEGGGEVCTAATLPGDLVITEVMVNAKGADAGQEWIELYNASGVVQCLNGLTISVQGTSSSTKAHMILDATKSLEVPAGAYALLGAGTQTSFIHSWSTDTTFASGAFFDTSAEISIKLGADVIDSVAYGEMPVPTCPQPKEGLSLSLCGECLAATCNDVVDNWELGKGVYDPTGNEGTPGVENRDCECAPPEGVATLRAPAAGDLVFTEVFGNILGTEDTNKEWFEVHVLAQDAAIDFAGVGIVKTKGEAPVFTLAECYAAAPGSYVVFGGSMDPLANGGATVNIEYDKVSINNSNGYLALVLNGVVLAELDYKTITENVALQYDEGSMTWCDAKTTYGDQGSFGSPGSPNPSCSSCYCTLNGQMVQANTPGPGDLFLTELLPNTPGDEDADLEWFEVKVTAATDVDLNCIELWKGVADDKATHTVNPADTQCLRYGPGSIVVLARSNDPAVNGIPAGVVGYVYSSLTMSGDGELALKVGPTVIDSVSWSSADDGIAFQKDPTSGQWCNAVTQYWTEPKGGKAAFGTPGTANTPCGVAYCNANGTSRPVNPPAAGDLVISEVFANPSGNDDAKKEWVEVTVLPGAMGKDMNGIELLVKGDSKGKLGGEVADCMPITTDYLLLVKSTVAAENGGLPDGGVVVSGMALVNSDATVALSLSGSVIDSMTYATAPDGKALQLDPTLVNATANDDPMNWCEATKAYNATPDLGTPMAANTACGASFCNDAGGNSKQVTPPVVGGVVITEIYANTKGAEDASKEWFEVTVPNTSAPFQINGTGIIDEAGKAPAVTITAAQCIELAPGGVYVFCRNADPVANGGLPATCIAYSSVSLINDNGYLGLGVGPTVYDAVPDYGKGTDGVSKMLTKSQYTAVGNDNVANWCDTPASNTYGTTGAVGTPGVVNPECP